MVVVGRLEGTDGLAHEREIAGERTDGENKRLFRTIPRFFCPAIKVEEHGGQAASPCHLITAIESAQDAAAGCKVNDQYPEMIPDQGSAPLSDQKMFL
jgi:hypothetical protein